MAFWDESRKRELQKAQDVVVDETDSAPSEMRIACSYACTIEFEVLKKGLGARRFAHEIGYPSRDHTRRVLAAPVFL